MLNLLFVFFDKTVVDIVAAVNVCTAEMLGIESLFCTKLHCVSNAGIENHCTRNGGCGTDVAVNAVNLYTGIADASAVIENDIRNFTKPFSDERISLEIPRDEKLNKVYHFLQNS